MEPGWDDSERRFARASALGVVCVAAAYLLTGAIGLVYLGASPPGSVTPPEPFVTLCRILMLLLVPFLITLFASLRAWAPPGLGTHALAAFGFVLVLAVITTVDTFLAGVVFRPGTQAYSDLWTRAILPLELLAWGPVFGLALLLASRLFVGHGLERAVRLLLVLAGALCCLNALCFVTGDLRFAWSGIAGYDFVFVAVCVLLVRLFARGRAR